jgi:hypothetical protein
MNVVIGTEAAHFPEKKIHKWDFPCSVVLSQLVLKYKTKMTPIASVYI